MFDQVNANTDQGSFPPEGRVSRRFENKYLSSYCDKPIHYALPAVCKIGYIRMRS